MDNNHILRQLTALMNVVVAGALDGPAFVALVAACPEPLPKFAYALAQLITDHPEAVFATDKLVGALKARIDRLQAPRPASTIVDATTNVDERASKPQPKRPKRAKVKPMSGFDESKPNIPPPEVPPAILYDDSPEGERIELAGLRDRVAGAGAGAFSDYMSNSEMVPCVPAQMLVLRSPDCLEWDPGRLVAALDELIATGGAKQGPVAWRLPGLTDHGRLSTS